MRQKQSLCKCNHCGAYRQPSQFGILPDGKRTRACLYCSGKAQLSLRDERSTIVARECGVCGKPMHAPNKRGGWLCSDHVEKGKRSTRSGNTMCGTCPHLLRCTKRINRALWVLCELPGQADVDRVRAQLADQSLTNQQVIDYSRENY